MKVCIINEFFYPDNGGGTGTVLSGLVGYLQKRYPELSIDVITTRSLYRSNGDKEVPDELAAHEEWEGVHIFRLGVPRPKTSKIAVRLGASLLFSTAVLWKLLRQRRYDLLLVTTAPPTLPMVARVLKILLGVPYIYVIYDLFPDVPIALNALRATSRVARLCKRLQRGWLHASDRVIVLGRCMQEHLIKQYGLSPEQIEVIPIWSDPDQITPLGKNTNFRSKNGLRGTVVLYAGNFGQCQNLDNLLDAAQLLQKTRADISFALVGDGPKREHLAHRIRSEKLHNVRMFPFVAQSELPDLLASADISVVSLEAGAEGLGVPSKFYNILASGRPTLAVASSSSEVARVVEEGECGVVVAQDDPQKLANALAKLSAQPKQLDEMGQRARQVLEDRFTLDCASGQFCDVFNDLLGDLGERPLEGVMESSAGQRVVTGSLLPSQSADMR